MKSDQLRRFVIGTTLMAYANDDVSALIEKALGVVNDRLETTRRIEDGFQLMLKLRAEIVVVALSTKLPSFDLKSPLEAQEVVDRFRSDVVQFALRGPANAPVQERRAAPSSATGC
ncbi:MAG TPA: hypothetical protein VLD59_16235 [Steroidobacteraceae bacterium]|nr:hypothetical protein [Steroidobacteraceae bacterium]